MDLNNSLWSGATLRLPWENILMYREQCKRPVQCNADLLNNVKPNPSTIDVDHLLSVNCWVDSHGEFLWIVCVTNKNGAYSGLHKLNLVNHFPLMVITIQICLSHISLSRFCVHSHVDTEFFLLSSFWGFIHTSWEIAQSLSCKMVFTWRNNTIYPIKNKCEWNACVCLRKIFMLNKLNISYPILEERKNSDENKPQETWFENVQFLTRYQINVRMRSIAQMVLAFYTHYIKQFALAFLY